MGWKSKLYKSNAFWGELSSVNKIKRCQPLIQMSYMTISTCFEGRLFKGKIWNLLNELTNENRNHRKENEVLKNKCHVLWHVVFRVADWLNDINTTKQNHFKHKSKQKNFKLFFFHLIKPLLFYKIIHTVWLNHKTNITKEIENHNTEIEIKNNKSNWKHK